MAKVGADHLSTARWRCTEVNYAEVLYSDGTDINEIGITPEYVVENDPDSDEDLQLQKAISLMKAECLKGMNFMTQITTSGTDLRRFYILINMESVIYGDFIICGEKLKFI